MISKDWLEGEEKEFGTPDHFLVVSWSWEIGKKESEKMPHLEGSLISSIWVSSFT